MAIPGVDIFGYLGGIGIAIALTPQVVKSWKTKSTKDISFSWMSIYVLALVCWVIYGFGIKSYPVIFLTNFELLLALILLALKIKYG
ncbi:SemiSWEET family sugar transporter [Nanoarchaeota archaeon]